MLTQDRCKFALTPTRIDRKSTRLNSSHQIISYAVFCLKKQKVINNRDKVIANYRSVLIAVNYDATIIYVRQLERKVHKQLHYHYTLFHLIIEDRICGL